MYRDSNVNVARCNDVKQCLGIPASLMLSSKPDASKLSINMRVQNIRSMKAGNIFSAIAFISSRRLSHFTEDTDSSRAAMRTFAFS